MVINAVLFVLAILFAIIEILTPGFFALSISAGLVVAAVVAFATHSIPVLIISFAIGMCIFFFALRPLFMKRSKNEEKTVTDALIGKKALVTQPINNLKGSGRCTIESMDWRARSSEDSVSFSVGEEGIIDRVEGVTLFLKKGE